MREKKMLDQSKDDISVFVSEIKKEAVMDILGRLQEFVYGDNSIRSQQNRLLQYLVRFQAIIEKETAINSLKIFDPRKRVEELIELGVDITINEVELENKEPPGISFKYESEQYTIDPLLE